MSVEGKYASQNINADDPAAPIPIPSPLGHPDGVYYVYVEAHASIAIELVDAADQTAGIPIASGSGLSQPFGPYRRGGNQQHLYAASPATVRVITVE